MQVSSTRPAYPSIFNGMTDVIRARRHAACLGTDAASWPVTPVSLDFRL